MVNLTDAGGASQVAATRCPHAPDVTVMVAFDGSQGERLQRFSCGICRRGWWESDGGFIDLDEAVEKMRVLAQGLHARRLSARAEKPKLGAAKVPRPGGPAPDSWRRAPCDLAHKAN
jgi:hypothetical protein